MAPFFFESNFGVNCFHLTLDVKKISRIEILGFETQFEWWGSPWSRGRHQADWLLG